MRFDPLYSSIQLLLLVSSVSLHEQDTLRLVQVIHTSGDRTPSSFVHNDPFSDVSRFWKEGVGQLTNRGRHRMYSLGQRFHEKYRRFVQKQPSNIEKFVYVQSSGSRRCLESTSAFVAGLFGGETRIQINDSDFRSLSKYWRPIPIHSVTPKGSDPMLDFHPACPNAESEIRYIELWDMDMQEIFEQNRMFIRQLSRFAGQKIRTPKQAYEVYQELAIENEYGYHWWQPPFNIWTRSYELYALLKLRQMARQYWAAQYNSSVIQRLLVGELIKEVNSNIRQYVNGSNRDSKMLIYSTHDPKILMLLQTLGVNNRDLIPPGASVVFELHQDRSKFFEFYIRMYYFDRMDLSDDSRVVPLRMCPEYGECPVVTYLDRSSAFEPGDWQYECGMKPNSMIYFVANIGIVGGNALLMFILLVIYNLYIGKMRRYIN